MAKKRVFIFTAGNVEARAHLDDSIRNPVDLNRALAHFSADEQERIRAIAAEHGLYAWGAIPGPQNTPRWEAIEAGDWMLCVFEHHYRYAAQVIAKYDNESFANDVWGRDPDGRTWSLMYFLTAPRATDVSVSALSNHLNSNYMGFFRISDEKVDGIEQEYGSVDRFMETELMSAEDGAGRFVDIPDGITKEDVLKAIADFDAGVEHDFGDSTKYDLIHESKRYPPKAILGLAARRLLGRVLKSREFVGGDSSKAFRVLRELGFRIEPKPEPSGYFLIRLNEESQYSDELGSHYAFTSAVPNQKKLRFGGHVVVDRKSAEGPVLLGYGALGAAKESSTQDGTTTFEATFEEWHPIAPPSLISEQLQQKIRSVPNYNVQHAIRPITKELYAEMIGKSPQEPICLLGTSKTTVDQFEEILEKIKARGGWASWWSFLVPDEFTTAVPFWLYANEGKGRFPVRAKVTEFRSSPGNDGIPSPWPDFTDEQERNITRAGPKQSEVCKTWLRLTEIERLEPALTTDDFEPAPPWSNEKNLLNQNAFGFARRRTLAAPSAVPSAPYSIEDALQKLFIGRDLLTRILAGLERKMNIILQGPPGVGKTFAARELAYALMGAADDNRVEMVQFHQSYAYEDFVQGWRPTEEGGFQLKNGLFYRFCLQARQRPHDKFVFVIDEINRGNLSKILGELMMLIEPDKRGTRFAMPLTYSKNLDDRFFVPLNVYLIGLMNTADRSLAMVDYALRRRFMFFDLEPGFDASGFAALLQSRGASSELTNRIKSRMKSVNDEIERNPHLGRGFRIGHSYFCPADHTRADDAWYRAVVTSEVAPLIEEYWADQSGTANTLIGELIA
jgi:MoxR-like ATPase